MKRNQRGFLRGDELVGPYKSRVRVYESSGDRPCVWVSLTTHEDVNGAVAGKNVEETEAVALLTVAQALELAENLTYLVRNHFNLDWDYEL